MVHYPCNKNCNKKLGFVIIIKSPLSLITHYASNHTKYNSFRSTNEDVKLCAKLHYLKHPKFQEVIPPKANVE